MTATLPARTLRDDPDGQLPCMTNPKAWDIPVADYPDEQPAIRHQVLDAVRTCAACPALHWCAQLAIDNPPEHHCVQGGLIWPGLETHRKGHGVARDKANTPVPYEQWKPTLQPANLRRAA